MIVSVCADKGAPGVTDLATVLGVVWPGARVVLEADCSGGDLPFRMTHADGDRLLDAQPSLLSLAADSRGEMSEAGLLRYSQPTTLGVPVVPGALSAEAFGPVARLWPRVAEAAAGWRGTVIADLGRLQPGDPAVTVARASTAVLLLARPDLAGLYHLRDRVAELAATMGDPALERSPVAVVVRTKTGSAAKDAVAQVRAAALQPVVQTLEPQVVLPIAAPRVRAVVQAQVQADPAPQPVAQRVAQEAVPRAVQAAQAPLLRPVLAVRVVRLPAAQVARVQ